MTYNTNNTIVIAISNTGYTAELAFLPKCHFNLEDVDLDWIYASTNGTDYKHGDLADLKSSEISFSFVLYNQNKTDCFKNFIEHINTLKKYVLIWRHQSENQCPDCASLQNKNMIENLIDCKPFNHDGTKPIEKFMKNISLNETDYSIEFAKLIEESLKKDTPHLIALSIICQGYLAAHGRKDILSGWDDVWKKLPNDLKDVGFQLKTKSKTEEKGWWKPALGTNLDGKSLIEELEALDKAAEFKTLKENNDKSVLDALVSEDKRKLMNLVPKIYKFLKDEVSLISLR